MNEPADEVIGQDGAIRDLMDYITEAARESNGFVLEIGCGVGTGSTVAIQRGLASHPDPLHISIDLSDRMLWKPDSRAWHLILEDSRSTTAFYRVIMRAGRRRPGLIFIDTEHTYDQMKEELNIWGAMAEDSTVWLFHDTWIWGPPNVDMLRAIHEYAESHHWVYDDYRKHSHGLGRMRRGV